MIKDNQYSLKEAIDNMLDSYRLKSKLKSFELQTSWQDIVGKTIARNTEYMELKRGVLHLRFSSAPLRNELFMMRTQLKNRLNEALGSEVIKEIIIN